MKKNFNDRDWNYAKGTFRKKNDALQSSRTIRKVSKYHDFVAGVLTINLVLFSAVVFISFS